MSENYIIGAGQIFTLFFVMLGPLKMLGPFAKATHLLPPQKIRAISTMAVLLSLVSLVVGGYLGKFLLGSWGIPVSVLELTCGVIFFLMALMLILIPRKQEPAGTKSTPEPDVHAPGIAFSMIVTPYGMAVVIALLALSQSLERTLLVLGLLVFVQFLNLLSMFYIRYLMGKIGVLVMQMVGAAFAVLQASLAVQMILIALRMLKTDFPL